MGQGSEVAADLRSGDVHAYVWSPAEPEKDMEELIRTNDLVLISFIEALLRDAGINALVMDQNMSVLEGSVGVLPRRIMVPSGEIDEARDLIAEAGIGGELKRPGA